MISRWTIALVLTTALRFPSVAEVPEAEPPAHREQVEVTGSRLGAEIRPLVVLTREQLETLPVADTASALAYLTGVEVRERAPFGGQADLGLYGSSFEGVLLLVDGLPVTDPQTGHHLLEMLPPLQAVQRIEVLPGAGGASYGAGAFGGVVQIFTGSPQERGGAQAEVSAGQNRLRRCSVSGGLGPFLGAASRLTHGGYRPNTELSDNRVFAKFQSPKLDAFVIGQDKEFGAFKAFSDSYPWEWESVQGWAGAFRYRAGSLTVEGGYRQKRDRFLLDRSRPAFYDARHTTNNATAQVSRRGRWGNGELLVGLAGARETMDSNQLGGHSRSRAGAFAEYRKVHGPIEINLGMRIERMEARTEILPQGTLGWRAGSRWRWFASVGRSIRLASFTERFSRSPAWVGRPDLAPEQAVSLETGFEGSRDGWRWSVLGFLRHGRDLIDLVRPLGSSGPFQALNIQSQRLWGIEGRLEGTLGAAWHWQVATLWIQQAVDWPGGLQSRYVGDTLRHQQTAQLHWRQGRWTGAWILRAVQRNGQKAHGEFDSAFSTGLDRGGRARLRIEIRNLLNRPARQFFGAELAGRWIEAGLTFR